MTLFGYIYAIILRVKKVLWGLKEQHFIFYSGCGRMSSVSLVTRTKRMIWPSNLGHPVGLCAARFLELAQHSQTERRSLQRGVIDLLGEECAW